MTLQKSSGNELRILILIIKFKIAPKQVGWCNDGNYDEPETGTHPDPGKLLSSIENGLGNELRILM
jgi:hypothetical protein